MWCAWLPRFGRHDRGDGNGRGHGAARTADSSPGAGRPRHRDADRQDRHAQSRRPSGVPFTVTVRACDSGWNLVATTTDAIAILSSDASATLPRLRSAGRRDRQLPRSPSTPAAPSPCSPTTRPTARFPDGASAPVQSLVLQGFRVRQHHRRSTSTRAPRTPPRSPRIDPSGSMVSGFRARCTSSEITSFGDGRITPEYVTFSNGQLERQRHDVPRRRDQHQPRQRQHVRIPATPRRRRTAPAIRSSCTRVRSPALQLVVPGESPLPGSVSGRPARRPPRAPGARSTRQRVVHRQLVEPGRSADNARLTSNDPAASTPLTGVLTNGFRAVQRQRSARSAAQTLTVADLTNGSILGMTSAGIQVIPSAVGSLRGLDHRLAADGRRAGRGDHPRRPTASGNTIPNYAATRCWSPTPAPAASLPEFVTFTRRHVDRPDGVQGRGRRGLVRVRRLLARRRTPARATASP